MHPSIVIKTLLQAGMQQPKLAPLTQTTPTSCLGIKNKPHNNIRIESKDHNRRTVIENKSIGIKSEDIRRIEEKE